MPSTSALTIPSIRIASVAVDEDRYLNAFLWLLSQEPEPSRKPGHGEGFHHVVRPSGEAPASSAVHVHHGHHASDAHAWTITLPAGTPLEALMTSGGHHQHGPRMSAAHAHTVTLAAA